MIPIIWTRTRFLWLVAGLTFATFAGVRHHDFVLLDDNVHIQENPLFHPPSWEKVARVWRSPFQGLYIPMTYSVWALQAWLSGDAPWLFHVTNWALHVGNAVLVYLLLGLCLGGGGVGAALGALVFALHPVQAEAVSWVSATKDLLSAFLGLGSLYLYLMYARGSRRRTPYALSLATFALACLAKPSAVVIPLFAFLIEVGLWRQPWRTALIRLAPFAALALPVLLLTKAVQPDADISELPPWWARPLVAGDTISFYLSKLLFPIGLAPDYSRNPGAVFRHSWAYAIWVAPLAAAWLMRRRAPELLVAGAIFIAGVLPVLGIVAFYFQVFSTVADRYLYLSLFGVALGTGIFVGKEPTRRRVLGVSVVIAALALLTVRQVGHWRSSLHLFAHTLTVNPASVLAHNNLGTILEKRGSLDEALFHYEQSIALAPESVPPYYNAGRILAMQGKYDQAERYLKHVIEKLPGITEAHYTLGLIYTKRGDKLRAETHFRKAGRRPKG